MQGNTELSDIERRLLEALAQGFANKAIALELRKSENTIRNQLRALYRKIGANNRAHAVTWFYSNAPRNAPITLRAPTDRRQRPDHERRQIGTFVPLQTSMNS